MSIKKALIVGAALAIAGFGSAASADELLFTQEKSSRGAAVAIDYVSDGRAVGLQFEILLPEKAQVDLSGFAKELPKGFSFEHNVVDGRLIMMIVNDQSQALPAGLISLGTIRTIGGSGDLVLDRLYSADAQANLIDVKTIK